MYGYDTDFGYDLAYAKGGGGGGASPEFVFLADAEAPNGSVAGPIDTTGAKLIVIATGVGVTVSDSEGNTWTPLTGEGSGPGVRLYYCVDPVTDAAHTFTKSAGDFSAIAVQAFGNADIAPTVDDETGGTSNVVTTVQPGSITPSVDNCLLVSASSGDVGVNGASSVIADGFTQTATVVYTGGLSYPISMAYKIQTTAQAENPTWTWDTTPPTLWAAMAAFTPE